MDNEFNEKELDIPEEELKTNSGYLVIPPLLKWASTILIFALWIWAFVVYSNYLEDPESAASPSSIGLPSILLFSFSIIILFHLPWEKMGLRIKKIGALEFEEIINTQATEHAEEIGYLQKKIKEIELSTNRTGQEASTVQDESDGLSQLIHSFLKEYSRWAFSPLRIQNWGARQAGYQKLGQYSLPAIAIKYRLRELVSEGKIVTSISSKGNTLYKALK